MVEIVEAPKTCDKPAQLDELGKVLLKARDYIRKNGWCQNDMGQAGGTVCLLGAVRAARGHDPGNYKDFDAFLASGKDERPYVRRLGFNNRSSAWSWNDQFDRTQQEVEERLERAAYNL